MMNNPAKPPTILLTGGGTGGHITPLLAVAHELKRQRPDARVIYVGERGGKFTELTNDHQAIDGVYTIWAGKFRRYHGESWLARATDIKTIVLNVRDLFYFIAGTAQSWLLLGKVRPDTILLKGGFVGVPVGLAAAARKLPFVTHDSDAIPGLANRMVGRWAALHATALAPEEYSYPLAKVRQVGVLVEPNYHEITEVEQGSYKQRIGIPEDSLLLLVTGGSSGAQRLNEAVVKIIEKLLTDFPNLHVVHQVGKGKMGVYGEFHHDRLQVLEFMRPMYVYMSAADVVVSRGSANTIAELGVQKKPVIVVPSPFLTGGHQLKNAELLERQNAAVYVRETAGGTDSEGLDTAIRDLLAAPERRTALAASLYGITIKNAAEKLAEVLLNLSLKG